MGFVRYLWLHDFCWLVSSRCMTHFRNKPQLTLWQSAFFLMFNKMSSCWGLARRSSVELQYKPVCKEPISIESFQLPLRPRRRKWNQRWMTHHRCRSTQNWFGVRHDMQFQNWPVKWVLGHQHYGDFCTNSTRIQFGSSRQKDDYLNRILTCWKSVP